MHCQESILPASRAGIKVEVDRINQKVDVNHVPYRNPDGIRRARDLDVLETDGQLQLIGFIDQTGTEKRVVGALSFGIFGDSGNEALKFKIMKVYGEQETAQGEQREQNKAAQNEAPSGYRPLSSFHMSWYCFHFGVSIPVN